MSVSESLLERVQLLTPEQQREVMKFVDTLAKADTAKEPRQSLLGLCADLGIRITEEDIAQARKEMWGNFPREHF